MRLEKDLLVDQWIDLFRVYFYRVLFFCLPVGAEYDDCFGLDLRCYFC